MINNNIKQIEIKIAQRNLNQKTCKFMFAGFLSNILHNSANTCSINLSYYFNPEYFKIRLCSMNELL